MITYPSIDPVLVAIGPVQVHWYGVMYLLGFMLAWRLAKWRTRHLALAWSMEEIGDLLFYGALGVIIGGRVGYLLIYDWMNIPQDPFRVLRIWEGGMSFHGGLIGVIVAMLMFAKRVHRSFWTVTDFLVPLVPLGLGLGRLGNFINAELWGRVTNVPWAMVFPHGDMQPRHPSPLYEACLEGLLLFAIVWWYANRPRPTGAITAVFLIGYAVCRFIAEFFREPDVQLGFVALDWLTMGQLLSIPMLLGGIILLVWARRKA